MTQIDFIARALTVIIVIGFLIGGIFGVLNNIMVKIILFGAFLCVVVYMFIKLFYNENHPST